MQSGHEKNNTACVLCVCVHAAHAGPHLLRDRGGRQFEPVNRCEKIYYKSRFLGHFFSDGKKKKKRNVEEEEKKKANAISTLTGLLLLKQPIDYHSNSVRIYSIRREYMKYDPYRWPRTLDRIYSSFDIIFQWKIYEKTKIILKECLQLFDRKREKQKFGLKKIRKINLISMRNLVSVIGPAN
jgi:hypothetical protein